MNASIARTWPSAHFVGFERIWNELDRHMTQGIDQSNAFPRHNIIKIDEHTYQIELALAGYDREDLSIEIEDGVLVVSGGKEDSEVDYVHKGISTKKFRRTFRLNEHVEVFFARFENGMLTVELHHIVPDEKKPQTIDIE